MPGRPPRGQSRVLTREDIAHGILEHALSVRRLATFNANGPPLAARDARHTSPQNRQQECSSTAPRTPTRSTVVSAREVSASAS